MQRRQGYLTAAAALLLLGGVAVPQVANPPNALAAAYTYNCANPIAYDHQELVFRGAASDYHAVIGDATVESISPCSSPPDGGSISAILPANLQRSASPYDIVQLGWARCIMPAGQVCGDSSRPIPNDGHVHFVYICSDISGGVPCDADGWALAPVIGHRYRFRLEHLSTGVWKYTITDINTGVSHTASIPADWSLGDGAWWGGEAYDPNSMLGPANTGTQISMYWMQYLRNATGNNWQVAEPVTISKCQIDLVTQLCTGSWPSYFGNTVYSQNYTNDAINLWTKAH